VRQPKLSHRMGDREFARAGAIIGVKCGLRFHEGNREILEDGLKRAATAENNSVERLIERLEAASTDALLQSVVRHVTIGETYFFRHPEHFDALRERMLPELLRGREQRTLRAWSAGCATGEECYSIAMALSASAGPAFEVNVLGTDINKAALETARTGRYGRWSQRGPMPFLPGHTQHEADGSVRVSDVLRRRVRFEYLNLRDPIYPSLYTGTQGLDLIFCRNVLVYFLPEIAELVMQRFSACLVEGGWLVVSAFDAQLALPGMEAISSNGTTVLRKTTRRAAVATTPRTSTPNTPARKVTVPVPTVSSDTLVLVASAKRAADAGDLDRALVLARKAVAIERAPEALHLLALVLGELGEHDEKLSLLAEIVVRKPDYVLGHLGLGLAEKIDPSERARHLERVIALLMRRRDEEILPGPDPLPVSWVRKMAHAGLKMVTP
jgi:chemotaxis protein methyltransferase CheR